MNILKNTYYYLLIDHVTFIIIKGLVPEQTLHYREKKEENYSSNLLINKQMKENDKVLEKIYLNIRILYISF